MVEQLREGCLIPARENGLTGWGEGVSEGWGSHSTMLTLVPDQGRALELSQVVPYGVE
jgi:hypothetical protein